MADDSGAPRLIIEVSTSSLAGRRFAFTEKELRRGVQLGRAPDCHLRFDINHDLKVSAHHALILETRDGVFVRDRGSSNGLYVNGKRVAGEGVRVYDGAEVNLGQEGAVMRLVIPGEIETETLERPAPPVEHTGPTPKTKIVVNPTVREKPEGLTKFVNKVGDQVGAGDKTKRMIKEVADRLEARAASRRRGLVILAGMLFLLLATAGGIAAWYYQQNEKRQAEEQEQADADAAAREQERLKHEREREKEMEAMRSKVAGVEQALADEAKALREEQGRRFEELKREVDDATVSRIKEIAEGQLRDLREASEEQKRRLEELSKPPSEEVFRRLTDEYDGSVFLIYVQYALLDKDGNAVGVESGTGTGWLAAVTDDAAWVITNKHVVKPFLFKAELSISHAIRDVKPAPVKDWVIAAWCQGAKIRDQVGASGLSVEQAWAHLPGGTGGNGDISVAGFAEDEWSAFGDQYQAWLSKSGFRTDLPAAMVERIKKAGVHEMDTIRDLAVLRFERKAGVTFGKPLPIATDEELKGLHKLDPVMALGYPLGLSVIKGTTVTASPVTGEIRNLQWEVGVIGTSAPILPGNSGGPLIDANGRVVGVITRRFEATQGEAISAEHARKLLLDVVK
jgi:S1-C subfamily serine protease